MAFACENRVGKYSRFNCGPLTSAVYTANTAGNSVTVINGRTSKVTSTLTDGNGLPFAIAANPLTATAYVTNRGDGTVSLNTN